MTGRLELPSEATLSELRELAERSLSREEVAAALAVPIDPGERAAALELVEWFGRRYPTPAERLAYARRAYRRWRARPFRPAR